MKLLKKAKIIQWLSIVNFILIIAFFVLLFMLIAHTFVSIPFLLGALFLWWDKSYIESLNFYSNELYPDYKLILDLCQMVFYISLAFTIIYALIIFCTNWDNKLLNHEKKLWGTLSILCLGPIASLIFASKVKNTLTKQSNDNEIIENKNLENDSQD